MQIGIGEFFHGIGDFFRGGRRSMERFWKDTTKLQISEGKVIINTDAPHEIYTTIPQIRIPINRLASMFANGVYKMEMPDKTIKDLPDDWFKLFNKPNVLQSGNAFMETYMKQLKIYGNNYIRKSQPSKLSIPKSLINISPTYLNPVLTGKLFDQVDMEGIVKYYEYTENGSIKRFETKEILWSRIEDIDNPLIGQSVTKSMRWPISNTDLAYKYLNAISGKKGYLGILSYESKKDSAGELPQSPEEKREIERLYKEQNGVEDDQKQTLITSASVKYTPTTYPTGQLLLLEQIDANALTILDELGVNRNLFLNSTYDNLKHGLRSTQTDTVQPIADSFCQSMDEFTDFNAKTGGKLILDYSHLSYMQADNLQEANTFASVSSALNALVSSGIITNVEAKLRLTNQFGKS